MSIRMSFAAALAAALLALPSQAAATPIVEVEPSGAFTATSSGKLTFGEGPEVACNVTIGGTLASSFAMIAGASAGSIGSFRAASCEGGTFGAVLSQPWDLEYQGLVGPEPEAASAMAFAIDGFAVNFSTFFGLVNCLYAGTATVQLELSGGNPWQSGQLVFDEAVQLPFIRGSGACPGEIAVRGALTPDQLRAVKAKEPFVEINPGTFTFPQAAGAEWMTFEVSMIGTSGRVAINRTALTGPGAAYTLPAERNACIRSPTVVLERGNPNCQLDVYWTGVATQPTGLVVRQGGIVIGEASIRLRQWRSSCTRTSTSSSTGTRRGAGRSASTRAACSARSSAAGSPRS
jgi:hypothetical protein